MLPGSGELAETEKRHPRRQLRGQQQRGIFYALNERGELLRQLMERGLVRIAGRHDSLGRPVLYGTTRKFLQVFGLKSLRDLPQADQLRPPGPEDESEK